MIQVRHFVALLLAVPAGLAAQQTSTCDVDENKPQKLALAAFNLQRSFGAPKPEDKAKILRDVVKGVTEEDKKNENPVGKAYVLGRALMMFESQPELITGPTRSALGFATNGAAPAPDLLVLADSLFTVVERAHPGCADDISQWRHQSPWFKTIQAAFTAMQAEQWDSAATLARRSMVINRASAYGPYVLGTVAASARDHATAAAHYKRAIELAGTDTSYAEIRRRSLFEIGRLAANEVDTATGPNKVAKAREAIAAFNAYVSDVPGANDAPAVRNTLVEMYMAAGDSASVPSIYADLIANPSKYDDIALVQAGVIPTRLNRSDDAAKLFAAALETNPNQRDALSNLAAMYFAMDQFKEMIPVVDRLVKVDPSNPDNWLLYAFAYQGLQRAEKNAALKRAYTDSLIKYNKRSEDMPLKVSFSGFTRGESETTLSGDIENRGAAAKTYSLEVEFLDKAGNVITTQTVSVGPVAPKESTRFTVRAGRGGIAAFRYAPLS